MKKALMIIASAFVGMSAMAADNYIGGSVGVMRNSTTKTTTATIKPEIGHHLSDKWAIGTSIGYTYTGYSNVNNHSFVFDPYARYYFYKKDRLSLFIEGGVDLSLGRTHYKGGDNSDTSVTVGIGLRPGIAYDINSQFSLVAHLGMAGYVYGNDAAKAAKMFTGGGVNLSDQVSFGLSYSF